LKQLAQLVGESPEIVVVEHQLPQIVEVAYLGRQGPQLVVGNIEPLEVVEERDGGGDPEQGVVIEVQCSQVLQLPQLGGQILDGAGDL